MSELTSPPPPHESAFFTPQGHVVLPSDSGKLRSGGADLAASGYSLEWDCGVEFDEDVRIDKQVGGLNPIMISFSPTTPLFSPPIPLILPPILTVKVLVIPRYTLDSGATYTCTLNVVCRESSTSL